MVKSSTINVEYIDMARATRVQMEPFCDYDYGSPVSNCIRERPRSEIAERYIDESQVVQGTVLWLPAREELPERAVRRAHGKGAIEEGIFNHPVVVVSRPQEESHVIHFHLITSLQGKRLEQLYSKSNEFHASRRSWYLPVAPTPDHPDAVSKKAKKRFPTLQLANGTRLRWPSYVNIRHVYKIDFVHLRAYANPETPHVESYHLERDSLIRMLAKGKSLTLYEPGAQFVGLGLQRTRSEPTDAERNPSNTATLPGGNWAGGTMPPSAGPLSSWHGSGTAQGDFRKLCTDAIRIVGTPPKVPPDGGMDTALSSMVHDTVIHPLEQLSGSFQSMAIVTQQNMMTACQQQLAAMKSPLDRAWMDFKGVTAVVIASL